MYNLDNKKVEISRDVVFHESIYPYLNKAVTYSTETDLVLPFSLIEDNAEVVHNQGDELLLSDSLSLPGLVSPDNGVNSSTINSRESDNRQNMEG